MTTVLCLSMAAERGWGKKENNDKSSHSRVRSITLIGSARVG
jgi:hypothetical protein